MRTFTLSPFIARRTLASDLWNEMDKIFEPAWSSLNEAVYDERAFGLQCDLVEEKDRFLMSIDLPGMKAEDIKTEVKENILTVSGERKRRQSLEGSGANREEKSYGFFSRSFTLPKSSDVEHIEATYEDGVLELSLPKSEAAKPRQIAIQSGKKGIFNKLLGNSSEEAKTKTV